MTDAHLHEAIRTEQAVVDAAGRRLRVVVAEVERALGNEDGDETGTGWAAGEARRRMLRARRAELSAVGDGLVFGRIDDDGGATHHVGRVGIGAEDESDEPLVLDWRAPRSRAFYTATPLSNQGLRRRRHIRIEDGRVTGVSDEPLGDSGDGKSADGMMPDRDRALVGEAALLRALDERRTGRMGTAVATLQREQDEIIRASTTGPLLVQGGPGTGKTVVALHRVAYLLFTHRRMAEQGVLVLGPNRRFLDYISQVLPALGESAVVSTTLDRLLPGVRAARVETREEARVKGLAGWQDALVRHVAGLQPQPGDLVLEMDGEPFTIGEGRVDRALRLADGAGRNLTGRRRRTFAALRDLLVEEVASSRERALSEVEDGFEDILAGVDASLARRDVRGVHSGVAGTDVDGVMSEADVEVLRTQVEVDRQVAERLDRWWPLPDAARELRRLLEDSARLRTIFPELTAEEADLVRSAPDGWCPSDLPLLDALADLIGDPDEHPGERDRSAGGPQEFLADRAAETRDWVYGHVVVDEAQELSPMQWQMVLRRAGARSVTAVGDIDQTSAAHDATTWAEALGAVWGQRWRRADLTVCYRTPREVMALTEPVLRAAGSLTTPAVAVRSSGVEPWVLQVDDANLEDRVRACIAEVGRRRPDGSVGVVGSLRCADRLRSALEVPVLTATQAKGLEWDATVIVDPGGIAAEPRGWNGLYVALTRCTQELGQVVVDDEVPRPDRRLAQHGQG